MNKRLKGKIVENFGTQWNFAQKARVPEAYVSKVVRGKLELSDSEKNRWAKLLNTGKEVFSNA